MKTLLLALEIPELKITV